MCLLCVGVWVYVCVCVYLSACAVVAATRAHVVHCTGPRAHTRSGYRGTLPPLNRY